MSRRLKQFSPLIVAVTLALIPAPEGLAQNAWFFLSIFAGVIVGLITEPIPAALIGLSGVSLVAVLGLVDATAKGCRNWALSGFSNGVIWLIFSAFMFALGYKKTGLGRRISLLLIKHLGKNTLGLGYAIAFSDGLLSPFMPSNTARSAGIIYPVVSNIPPMFDSSAENNPRRIGSYLCWVSFAASCVTSSMFMTSMAPNLLTVEMIANSTGTLFTWGDWARVMVPAMLPMLLITPLLAYVVYPPEIKHSPEAPAWAAEELAKMGKVTRKELLMLSYALAALILWMFGKELNINGTVAAMFVLSLMVLTRIVSWDDVLSNKAAWNVLIWFATLVAMASGLQKTGVLSWLGNLISAHMHGYPPLGIALALVFIFFIVHYCFASTTAHMTALLPLFIAIATPLLPAAMLPKFAFMLATSLGVMGIITPYATGPAPIWYGSGYIPQARWWLLGAIFGGLYLATMLVTTTVYVR